MTTYTAADVPEALIDEHRYMDVEFDDWYDDIIDDWAHEWAFRGIDVSIRGWRPAQRGPMESEVYFNVGWGHQYVVFKGDTTTPSERERMLRYLGAEDRFPAMDQLDAEWRFTAEVRHYGGSSVGWTLELDPSWRDDFEPEDEDDGAAQLLMDMLESEMQQLESLVHDAYEQAASELFDNLSDELEYRTSDEYIAERIAECYPEWIDDYYKDHPDERPDEQLEEAA